MNLTTDISWKPTAASCLNLFIYTLHDYISLMFYFPCELYEWKH